MKLALKTITKQLTVDNILLELFSAFTSRCVRLTPFGTILKFRVAALTYLDTLLNL